MLLAIFLITLGSAILYFSSDTLVKGASSVATRHKLSQFFIGMTIVSVATSAPEFFVSLLSAVRGHEDISFGNIIGSNIANIGLVLGFAYLAFEKNKFLNVNIRDLVFLILSSIALLVAVITGGITRYLGFVFVVVMAIFLYTALRRAKTKTSDEPTISKWKEIVFILLGAIGLPLGANIFVKGGVQLATILGLSEFFMGLTIMAVGTSLPELATSMVASIKRKHGISIGNIVGANTFNVFAWLGLIGLVHPIKVPKNAISIEIPFLFALSILICIFVSRKNTRHYFGAILLLAYTMYVILALYRG